MKTGLLLSMLLASAVALAAPDYKVTAQIAIDGPVRWDYLQYDAASQRLFVANGTQTDVIDTRTGKLQGVIAATHGVHGIAIAHDLGLGFTSNGADNEIGEFALDTLQPGRRIKVGSNPDAIVYDAATQRVVTFNGKSQDISIVNAKTGELVQPAIAVGGKPEFAQTNNHGLVFFNIEDTNEVAVLDIRKGALVQRYSISPCDSPTGLARDETSGHLYSVCGNGVMVISDPVTGKVLGQAPIGRGADGVALLDGYAISANGRDGTVSVVAQTAPNQFATVAIIKTAPGARTIAADTLLHKLYLPTASFKPQDPAASAGGPGARPVAQEGTFRMLVLGR